MRYAAFLALLLGLNIGLTAGAQANENDYTTGRYYDICKSALDDNDNNQIFNQGRCSGALQALSFVSEQLSGTRRFCSPADATGADLIRALLAYVDRNAAEAKSIFMDTAIRAYRDKWPCK